MATTDAVRARVAAATAAALLRLAGGGRAVAISSHSNSNDVNSKNPDDREEWAAALRRLALSSVSFPNGGKEETEGAPHDVEVRAALALFKRVRGAGSKKKGKRKRRQLHQKEAGGGESPTKKEEGIEITSDFGTRRKIDSAKGLAELLAAELEGELRLGQRSDVNDDRSSGTSQQTEERTHNPQTVQFADVRSDSSGILRLLSTQRAERLRAAGRVPCPSCPSWPKGAKGLWWHRLAAHGVEYAAAAEGAAGSEAGAVVPYRERAASLMDDGTEGPVAADITGNRRADRDAEEDAFQLVKLGRYETFVHLVERGEFDPKSEWDRNGATVVHWAAGRGRLDLVRYLIEKWDCCPNQPQRGKRSFGGRTPLHWAARNGHLAVVEYLVCSCGADVDAATSDGTTAFCWAVWQGHLEIMKFLHRSGCDVHASNSFGCNAVLWSAQGAGTGAALAWLWGCGVEFRLLNSNGHGALHKAAQRGCRETVEWLADAFLCGADGDGSIFVGPDAEGNCPSDLAGMEGHEHLAIWIAERECEYFAWRWSNTPTDGSFDNNPAIPSFPSWLREALATAALTARPTLYLLDDDGHRWGTGGGVRRIVRTLLLGTRAASASKAVEPGPKADFDDID
ncbi:hypothetical protein ACHAXT_009010 [Thalassiosira profunda]